MDFKSEYGGQDKSMKILTAANHAAMLNELGKALSEIFPDSELIQEADALMAAKYAFNHEVDIVFAEADMKRMNGLQIIQFVRHEHPNVKSFLVGTEKQLAESLLLVSEDVTGFLAYPFAEDSVREVLQRNGQQEVS